MNSYERLVMEIEATKYGTSNAELFWSIVLFIVAIILIVYIVIAYKNDTILDKKEGMWKTLYIVLTGITAFILCMEIVFWLPKFNHWLNTL